MEVVEKSGRRKGKLEILFYAKSQKASPKSVKQSLLFFSLIFKSYNLS